MPQRQVASVLSLRANFRKYFGESSLDLSKEGDELTRMTCEIPLLLTKTWQ